MTVCGAPWLLAALAKKALAAAASRLALSLKSTVLPAQVAETDVEIEGDDLTPEYACRRAGRVGDASEGCLVWPSDSVLSNIRPPIVERRSSRGLDSVSSLRSPRRKWP